MIGALKTIARWVHPGIPGGLSMPHYQGAAAALFSVAGISGFGHVRSATAPRWAANPAVASVSSAVEREPIAAAAPIPLAVSSPWYVADVRISYGNGRTQDVSAYINAEGDKYHVSPVFIAATIMTESNFYVYAERWAGGLDNSCGLMQQIITNVTAETGITDARAACNWEENPYNSIDFGTRILRDDMSYHGWRILPPNAYIMYNAGAGLPDWYYASPTGQAATNFYGNFLPKWSYVLATYAASTPPTPAPPPIPKPATSFPVKVWNQYRIEHHRRLLAYRTARGQLTWTAHIYAHAKYRTAGGITHRERYNARDRYMQTGFQGFDLFWWPGHARWAPVWRRRVHPLH